MIEVHVHQTQYSYSPKQNRKVANKKFVVFLAGALSISFHLLKFVILNNY